MTRMVIALILSRQIPGRQTEENSLISRNSEFFWSKLESETDPRSTMHRSFGAPRTPHP